MRKLLVYNLHDLKVPLWLSLLWLVIIGAFRNADYTTLIFNAQILKVWGNQSSAGIGIPSFCEARFAKSSITSSFPIFAYSI